MINGGSASEYRYRHEEGMLSELQSTEVILNATKLYEQDLKRIQMRNPNFSPPPPVTPPTAPTNRVIQNPFSSKENIDNKKNTISTNTLPTTSDVPVQPLKKAKIQDKSTKEKSSKKKDSKKEEQEKSGENKDKKGSRFDSSLTILTSKFINEINKAKDGIIDLNDASVILNVKKRRIYDITGVLEGIGLIEKRSKNNIQWKGNAINITSEDRKLKENQRQILESLQQRNRILDEEINKIRAEIKELANNSYAYVTHDDIRNLPSMQGQTMIAIKAPSGTRLEVPDPDEVFLIINLS